MKTFAQVKQLIADPIDFHFYDHCYLIGNEFGLLAIVYADNEQSALDAAADSGKLDCQLVPEWLQKEALDEGWEDEFLLLGNASEPFDQTYLWITERK